MGQSGRDLKEDLWCTLWPHCRILCLPFHQCLPDSELTYNWKLDERLWFSLLATQVRFLDTKLAESPDQLTFSRWTSSFLGDWSISNCQVVQWPIYPCYSLKWACPLVSANWALLLLSVFLISHHPDWNKEILLSLSFGSTTWHMGF